jgi:hypothetical protein
MKDRRTAQGLRCTVKSEGPEISDRGDGQMYGTEREAYGEGERAGGQELKGLW